MLQIGVWIVTDSSKGDLALLIHTPSDPALPFLTWYPCYLQSNLPHFSSVWTQKKALREASSGHPPPLSSLLQFFAVPITTWHFSTCALFVSSWMSAGRTLLYLLLNPQHQKGRWAHGTKKRCMNVCWRMQKIRSSLEVYQERNSKTVVSRQLYPESGYKAVLLLRQIYLYWSGNISKARCYRKNKEIP